MVDWGRRKDLVPVRPEIVTARGTNGRSSGTPFWGAINCRPTDHAGKVARHCHLFQGRQGRASDEDLPSDMSEFSADDAATSPARTAPPRLAETAGVVDK